MSEKTIDGMVREGACRLCLETALELIESALRGKPNDDDDEPPPGARGSRDGLPAIDSETSRIATVSLRSARAA